MKSLLTGLLMTYNPTKADWQEAAKDGIVKIPLSNPDGHAWFASMNLGTPMQDESICVFDNNSALSLTFSKNCDECPHWKYNQSSSRTF